MTDGEAEALTDSVTHPKSHSSCVAETPVPSPLSLGKENSAMCLSISFVPPGKWVTSHIEACVSVHSGGEATVALKGEP